MNPDAGDAGRDPFEPFAELAGDDELLAELADVLEQLSAAIIPPDLDVAAVWADIDRRLDDDT